jgi:hypothetical protein
VYEAVAFRHAVISLSGGALARRSCSVWMFTGPTPLVVEVFSTTSDPSSRNGSGSKSAGLITAPAVAAAPTASISVSTNVMA